ncbi:hypothetical protein RchiOBHm_Chr2g0148491 [Rosa chinensis]|uniref:Uncharacterized protein n=1 Tax=Rosa chinensis TaxID=74649 RepID=A0A2P6RZG0_ROSCH|nr:hypothetical protein RchiOBHm_Chr2g0148491 [Rosa chinensis]
MIMCVHIYYGIYIYICIHVLVAFLSDCLCVYIYILWDTYIYILIHVLVVSW